MVFKDSESLAKIAKLEAINSALEAKLKAQIAEPVESPVQEPVETPKEAPKVKQEDKPAPESKPEPVSALDAKRSELETDKRVLSLIYASLPAGEKRIRARKELKLLDSRIKALG